MRCTSSCSRARLRSGTRPSRWLPEPPAFPDGRFTPPASPCLLLMCDQRLVLQGPIPVWSPTPEGIADTNMAAFMREFQARYVLPCLGYTACSMQHAGSHQEVRKSKDCCLSLIKWVRRGLGSGGRAGQATRRRTCRCCSACPAATRRTSGRPCCSACASASTSRPAGVAPFSRPPQEHLVHHVAMLWPSCPGGDRFTAKRSAGGVGHPAWQARAFGLGSRLCTVIATKQQSLIQRAA